MSKPGPRSSVQLDEWHDLTPFERPLSPIPRRVEAAIVRGVRSGDAPHVADPNVLLHRDGGDGLVDDIVRLKDGQLVVACLTEMPGVTAAMWDWWFSWHSYTAERYRLWHPQDHVGSALSEDRRHVDSIRERWVGNTSYVDESIGGPVQRLAIRFVAPESVGLDAARVDEIGLAICARTALWQQRLAAGHLIHLVESTEEGCRMHSRFRLGDVRSELPLLGPILTRIANRPSNRRRQLPNAVGLGLLRHCSEEMNHLASILPELYERFAGVKATSPQ